MIVLIVYAFTVAIYVVSTGRKTEVRDAGVAIVDADRSTLSARIKGRPATPVFSAAAERLIAPQVDQSSRRKESIHFFLEIPPRFEADLLAGRGPSVQINVDATAMTQAGVGTAYIQDIITARRQAS